MKKMFDQGRVQPMNEMGIEGSVPFLISGSYFGFDDVDFYKGLEEYPCQISALQANELMQVIIFECQTYVTRIDLFISGLMIPLLYHLPWKVHF